MFFQQIASQMRKNTSLLRSGAASRAMCVTCMSIRSWISSPPVRPFSVSFRLSRGVMSVAVVWCRKSGGRMIENDGWGRGACGWFSLVIDCCVCKFCPRNKSRKLCVEHKAVWNSTHFYPTPVRKLASRSGAFLQTPMSRLVEFSPCMQPEGSSVHKIPPFVCIANQFN